MTFRAALLLSLSLLSAVAYAGSIEMIQLNNRPAQEIIPIIQPMLGPDVSITGQGFQLFIRTSGQNLTPVRQMIKQLDTAAKLLLISVFQGNERDLHALTLTGDLRYRDDTADVRVGRPSKPARRGADIRYSTDNVSAGAHAYNTHGHLSDNPIHHLRVTEGTRGYIETGESVPYFTGGYWDGGSRGFRGRGYHYGGIEYIDTRTGFYVLPSVHGDQVTLDVSPHKERLRDDGSRTFETQSAATRITGPLGQWLPIGGISEDTHTATTATGGRYSTHNRNNASIWIKAELVQ